MIKVQECEYKLTTVVREQMCIGNHVKTQLHGQDLSLNSLGANGLVCDRDFGGCDAIL